MEQIDYTKIIIYTLSGAGSLAFAIVKYYLHQQKQLEILKQTRLLDAVQVVEKAIIVLKVAQAENVKAREELNEKIQQSILAISLVEEKLKSRTAETTHLIETIKEYTKNVERRVRNVEFAMDNGEIIRIGKTDNYIFKGKRRDSD